MTHSIYVDGSGGVNSGYGFFVNETGESFYENKPNITNNQAEYMAIISALRKFENSDDEINHEHYQEVFLPIARENAEINPRILDRAVEEFSKYYRVTFDVDLKKLFSQEARNDFGSWQ